MSMTVNTANGYTSEIVSSEQLSAIKKQESNPKEAENLEQKPVSSRPNRIIYEEDGASVSIIGQKQGTEQTVVPLKAAAPRTDTVEISEEGRAASARFQAQRIKADSVEETAYEEDDLSKYTDSELKQMYYSGDITLQEYEDETGEKLGKS